MPDNDLCIEYLKSGISVSTDSGCNIGCKYCIVGEFTAGQAPIKLSPSYIADEICKYRLYNKFAPIIINNRTDPCLCGAKANTFKLLEILDSRDIPNPRVIITKLLVGEKYYKSLSNLKYPTFLFRTFSGMVQRIEPTSTLKHLERIIAENEALKQFPNLHIVHYWRPIIPGINSDEYLLKEIFEYITKSFSCSVVSGIRVTPNLYKKLTDLGADLSGWNGDSNHKYLADDVYNTILELRNKYALDYPIFRNTSCAISALLGKPDYNLNFYKARFCHNCTNNKICATHIPRQMADVFDNMKYTFDGSTLTVMTPISQEQISYIKHQYGCFIKAKQIEKQKSELLLEKTYSG